MYDVSIIEALLAIVFLIGGTYILLGVWELLVDWFTR